MKNPLHRRVPKELLGEWRKYLVIFLFLTVTIGFISGTDVANNSMLKSVSSSEKICRQEDGHFVLHHKMTASLKKKLEKEDITIYKNYHKNVKEQVAASEKKGKAKGTHQEKTIRVYQQQSSINQPALLKGKLPTKKGEVAIDRMHADNNSIVVGDRITAGTTKLKVTGLIALPNYSTLFEKNTDSLFDAITFDVGVVTRETFKKLHTQTNYQYSWFYDKKPKNVKQEKKWADSLMKAVVKESLFAGNQLEEYVPNYLNQAIHFATDDFGRDKIMGNYLLYILVIVLAFIFAITINSTIEKEASVIGTLRASGYTRRELLFHYMASPVLVTLVAAVAGNVLGYTGFKNVIAGMYYNSYSLPPYETFFTSEAFWKTTIVPIVLMFVINALVISSKLKLSPLSFLRHDLTKNRKKKTMKLKSLPFINRFRIRIFLQNLPNYTMLLVGMTFVMILMLFSTSMPSTLKHYQKNVVSNMFVNYQYTLKQTMDNQGAPITTANKKAEKFSVRTLESVGGVHDKEAVTLYGVKKNSRYVHWKKAPSKNRVYISKAYQDKFGYEIGDTFTLQEKYTDKKHTLKVAGVTDYAGAISVFVTGKQFSTILNLDKGYWNGYMSNTKIKDIDQQYIAGKMTKKDVTKISRQLDHSMGNFMAYFRVACVILAAVLIYLLTKTIVERNRRSISIVKILGYYDREITSLYMTVTTIIVVLWEIIALLVSNQIVQWMWRKYLNTMDGWLAFYMDAIVYIEIFAAIFAAYLVISIFDFQRIRRIPMDEALKNVTD